MKNNASTRVLLTVGGDGGRLRAAGHSVPISKSFLEVNGKPIVYWNIIAFKKLGVNILVICAERDEKLRAISELISSTPLSFGRLEYHLDEGLGTAGLPFHCRQYFDGPFLFASGHSVVKLEHYAKMARLKSDANVIVSAFDCYEEARGVFLPIREGADLSRSGGEGYRFVDNPIAVDEQYVECLAQKKFDFYSTLQAYHKRGQLLSVKSDLPAEIDEASQLDHVRWEIMQYICDKFSKSHRQQKNGNEGETSSREDA